jgi:LemA protein
MKSSGLLILLAILAVVGFLGCNGYNGLVREDEAVKKAFKNVNAEYQTRFDLVGPLVETVKGAAKFEQSTLTAVVDARAKATSVNINVDKENLTPEKLAQYQAAQGQLTGSLKSLLATVEAYPTLKATDGYLKFQDQITGIEANIKDSRKKFNEAVEIYNGKARSFPMNILGGLFGFKAQQGFTAEAEAAKPVPVKF